MDAIHILSEAAMRASARILAGDAPALRDAAARINALGDAKYALMAEAMREAIRSRLSQIMGEWREATGAIVSQETLCQLVNAQAWECAIAAVQAGAARADEMASSVKTCPPQALTCPTH